MNPKTPGRTLGLLLLVPALLFAAADASQVVTRRGTATVRLIDVDAYVEQMPREQRSQFVIDADRVEKMLDNLLLAEQLANEQRELEKSKGLDPLLAARLRFVENEARAQFYLARIREEAPKVDVEALAREKYTAAPERFRAPDTLDLRHVLIKLTDRSEQDALVLAEKVRADALAHPDQFADLARRYSEDQTTAPNGGLLADVTAATLTPKFAEAALALTTPGQVSPVVQTPYGMHVIQLVARQPGQQRGFDEVKAELEEQVAAEAAGRWAQEKIEKLRNTPVETDDVVASSIRNRYDEPAAPKAP